MPSLAWLTQPVIKLITIDAPAYIQGRIEIVLGAISAIAATIKLATGKINQAKQATTDAKTQVKEVQGNATQLLNQNLEQAKQLETKTVEATNLNTQLTQVTETQRAAETLKIQQAQTLVNYEKEIKDLRVMLANRPVEVVTVTK